jgi:hypothetical protein
VKFVGLRESLEIQLINKSGSSARIIWDRLPWKGETDFKQTDQHVVIKMLIIHKRNPAGNAQTLSALRSVPQGSEVKGGGVA